MVKYVLRGAIFSLLALPASAMDMAELTGTWKPTTQSEVNLFNGDITITEIKKRTPGFYTLIYDKDKHGITCFYVPEGDYSVCLPVLLNKDKITPDDKIDAVMEGALTSSTMFVRARLNKEKLVLSIAPFGSDCTHPQTCVFKELPLYKKQ